MVEWESASSLYKRLIIVVPLSENRQMCNKVSGNDIVAAQVGTCEVFPTTGPAVYLTSGFEHNTNVV